MLIKQQISELPDWGIFDKTFIYVDHENGSDNREQHVIIKVADLKKLSDSHTALLTGNNEWVPVGERLPEKTGRYLVSRRDGLVTEADFIERPVSWWMDRCDEELTHTDKVAAWMPLPEAYKAPASSVGYPGTAITQNSITFAIMSDKSLSDPAKKALIDLIRVAYETLRNST